VTQGVTPVARLSFSAPVCFHLAFRSTALKSRVKK
jgi:hypothetical protein